MGVRQALGFVFTEVWFSIRDEYQNINGSFSLEKMLHSIANGIKNGFAKALEKYKEVIGKLCEGTFAGILSSLTTTLCNIFFTTAKNAVRVIRQTWSSIVEAGKTMMFNPDCLPYGQQMKAVAKIVATGASVVVGSLIQGVIQETPVGKLPVIGDIASAFCGSFVTGLMTVSLLYFMDRSKTVNNLVVWADKTFGRDCIDGSLVFFREAAKQFEEYAAKLEEVDIQSFRAECETIRDVSLQLEKAKNDRALNDILKKAAEWFEVKCPWGDSTLDDFMNNPDSRLSFSV
jgi:hypothetical protein